MPRPGVDVLIVNDAPPGGPQFLTGRAFFAGGTQRGPTDRAVEVRSVAEFERTYGARSGFATFYDSVVAFFTEGGASLLIARVAGATAAPATAAFGGLTAVATSPGAWGNGVTVRTLAPSTTVEMALAAAHPASAAAPESVPSGMSVGDTMAWVGTSSARAVAALDAEEAASSPRQTLIDQLEPLAAAAPLAAGDPVVIIVAEGGKDVERSTPVATGQDAIDWATASSTRVAFTGPADGALPAAGTAAVALAGGADDAGDADDVATALDLFGYGLGPGQVCVPGVTTTDVHKAVGVHCDRMQRVGIIDMPNSSDVLTIGAAIGALYGQTGVNYLLAVAPFANYPVRDVSGAVSQVPWSAIEAGMVARVDAQGNPAMPAAGANGISTGAVGLVQSFTQTDATALNDLGVTLARPVYGSFRTYGYRTAAGPSETNWLFFGESRVVMAIAHEGSISAENYVFVPIDGRGHVFGQLHKDLVGICARYYALDALYGASVTDAFRVDTGPLVNTDDTANRGEVHAIVKVKTSRDSEWVTIAINKVPLDRAL